MRTVGGYRRMLASSTKAWRTDRAQDGWADRAAQEGLRSRAAFKLQELNERFGRFLRPGAYVVDLGAAPGGFSVVAGKEIRIDTTSTEWKLPIAPGISSAPGMQQENCTETRKTKRRKGRLVCVDLQDMLAIPGARFILGDARESATQMAVVRALGAPADVVLSDLAPSTLSDPATSHLRSMQLAHAALDCARAILRGGGTMVCKVFAGKEEPEFRQEMRECFSDVRAFTPKACKKGSVEHYLVAKGFSRALDEEKLRESSEQSNSGTRRHKKAEK